MELSTAAYVLTELPDFLRVTSAAEMVHCKGSHKIILSVGRGWKRFAWLPLGTFAANMMACGTGGVIYAIAQTYVEHEVWSSVCNAIITGIHGSLSTASTWAGEVRVYDACRHRVDFVWCNSGNSWFSLLNRGSTISIRFFFSPV